MLQSPGIQFFESTVTPATEVVTTTNGVATLGFSTRGPVNTLTRVTSSSQFANLFGEPVADYPWSHILVNNVLNANSVVYFMRLASADAAKATCPVANVPINGAQVMVKETSYTESSYFTADWIDDATPARTTPLNPIYLRIYVTLSDGADAIPVDTLMTFKAVFGTGANGASRTNVLVCSMSNVIANLKSNATLNAAYTFSKVGNSSTGFGVLIKAKNEVSGYVNVTSDIGTISGTTFASMVSDTAGATERVAETSKPTAETSGTVLSISLRITSNVETVSDISERYHFNIVAKNPGSGMNDIKVIKTSNVSGITNTSSWGVSVVDTNGAVLESITGLTASTFIKSINDNLEFIEIDDEVNGSAQGAVNPDWKDGTYVLGKGELLSNGEYFTKAGIFADTYAITLGADGVPMEPDRSGTTYDIDAITDLYVAGLNDQTILNCDEATFSIVATPDCGELAVQAAAIQLCNSRGDSMYLVDVPLQYCENKKSGITQIVNWSNASSTFQSSQAAIYYGWFMQQNPFNTSSNIYCPASIYIAPKMIAIDNTLGEFYAPAGVQNGTIIVSDYIYSPDQEDKDLMVGNDNVVNPIVFSNSHGVICMAQKTTDRTTSPLNRVGIRRMTNSIKRQLRARLQALLFQPNNDVSRSRARGYCETIFGGLRSAGFLESYTINVQSGTGANRNDLNIYLSFAPYGLIEKIYVYVNITDSGVTITETV